MTDDLAAMDAAIQQAWRKKYGSDPDWPVDDLERIAYRAGHAAGVIDGMRRAAEIEDQRLRRGGTSSASLIRAAADALEGKK